MLRRTRPGFLLALFLGLSGAAAAAEPESESKFAYQQPPEPIASALEAPGPPLVLPSPSRDRLAILSRPALPSVAELAEPELGLAGTTINPRNNGPSRSSGYAGVTFRDLAGNMERQVAMPPDARLISAEWAPDGRHLAFLLLRATSVELWTAEAATGRAAKRAEGVNAAFPSPYAWFSDGSALLVRRVPEGRGAAPQAPNAPQGPVVRESGSGATPGQTLHNLLANAHDERLFDHYFRSRLFIVRLDGSAPEPVGDVGLIVEAQPSPDGRFILQHRLTRPYSHELPASAFPEETFVTDLGGRHVRTIADRDSPLPSLAALPRGPRAVRWRADAPSSLFWAEAAGGEPASDSLWLLDLPNGDPRRFAELDFRFQKILWARPELAVAIGISPQARAEFRTIVDPRGVNPPRLLQRRPFSGGASAGNLAEWNDDRLHLTPDGQSVFLDLPGALGRINLQTGAITRLWDAQGGERLFGPADRSGERLLVWRESATEPPNLHLVPRRGGEGIAVTRFTDPLPAYAGVQVRALDYRRADGRSLRGTLYLPAGYRAARDGPLPVLVWAYPGSVTGRPEPPARAERHDRFVRPSGFADLPLLVTGRGYALFEAAMPIFGGPDDPPNDSHVAQLVANAEAAIALLESLGVASRDRVAIGGHSYGAAMVANLLAHSDLFRTGIALSGAYNRTLTPFGFQASERRSFWEAPDVYLAMSPFVHADKLNEPILLVHGTADLNSGTQPMQSERLYEALAGLGRDARLVLLPNEDHQYRARESLMHLMWEMDRWLARHLGRTRETPD